jgi:hypothetical protein
MRSGSNQDSQWFLQESMTALHRQSPAFRKALFESERLRIYIFLAPIAFILAIRAVRTVIAPTPENLPTFYLFTGMTIAVVCVERATLRASKLATRNDANFRTQETFLKAMEEINAAIAGTSRKVASSTLSPAASASTQPRWKSPPPAMLRFSSTG